MEDRQAVEDLLLQLLLVSQSSFLVGKYSDISAFSNSYGVDDVDTAELHYMARTNA
jgi:hypothetical protein